MNGFNSPVIHIKQIKDLENLQFTIYAFFIKPTWDFPPILND